MRFTTKLKRKSKVIIILCILALSTLFLVKEEFMEGIWFQNLKPSVHDEQDLKILVATDIHYLSNNINDKGSAFQKYLSTNDSKQLDYITEITETFVDEVKKEKPEYLILSGDLTTNGEAESHKDLALKLKEIEEHGTNVLVIPGNHDINNPWAKKNNKKDEKLLLFTAYSKVYFDSKVIAATNKMIDKIKDCSQSERAAMLETMKIINHRVFQGTDWKEPSEIIESEGYKLWQLKGTESQKKYIDSLILDKDVKDTELTIKIKHLKP